MRTDLIDIADQFWKKAGGLKDFPADIARAVSLATPLNIIILSELSFDAVANWFLQHNILPPFQYTNRPIHGFLLVKDGTGFIFVDGTDSIQERRLTIAHELAHYLLHYVLPSKKVIAKFGDAIKEVLEGYRPATKQEEIDAMLCGIALKPFNHILEKDQESGDGYFGSYEVLQAENDSDALALELLAPLPHIRQQAFKQLTRPLIFKNCKAFLQEFLTEHYGLPPSFASVVSGPLALKITGGPSAMEQLGLT